MSITIDVPTLFACCIVGGLIAQGIVALVKKLWRIRDKEPRE